jgi:hypothetical protein
MFHSLVKVSRVRLTDTNGVRKSKKLPARGRRSFGECLEGALAYMRRRSRLDDVGEVTGFTLPQFSSLQTRTSAARSEVCCFTR